MTQNSFVVTSYTFIKSRQLNQSKKDSLVDSPIKKKKMNIVYFGGRRLFFFFFFLFLFFFFSFFYSLGLGKSQQDIWIGENVFNIEEKRSFYFVLKKWRKNSHFCRKNETWINIETKLGKNDNTIFASNRQSVSRGKCVEENEEWFGKAVIEFAWSKRDFPQRAFSKNIHNNRCLPSRSCFLGIS